MNESQEKEELLAFILDEYADSLASDNPVNKDSYYRKYPDLKDDLEEAFVSAELLFSATQDESSSQPIPEKIGTYQVLRKIGAGGMGVVYEAVEPAAQRYVALKTMHFHSAISSERSKMRFRAEFESLKRIEHPSVVKFLDSGEDQGAPFYTMELLEGESLSHLLRDLKEGNRAWNVQELVGYIIDAARALDHLHQQGIIHRDIKPSNLFLTTNGIVLTDFGLAKEEGRELTLTLTEEMVGTIKYMSPEQLLGKRLPIDHKSDIYSLGLVLYELITQSPPFEGMSAVHLLKKRISSDPVLPRKLKPEISRDLETIILKATDRDAEQRYTSAGDFEEDLERFLAYQKIKAKPLPVFTMLGRKVKAHPILASSFILIIFTGFLQWFLFQHLPLKKKINEGIRAFSNNEYGLAREIFIGLRQAQPNDHTIQKYYYASNSAKLFSEGLADLIQGNLDLAFKSLDHAMDSISPECLNEALELSGGCAQLSISGFPLGAKIELNRICFSDFLREEIKVLETVQLENTQDVDLKVGCYRVGVEAKGYLPLENSYLFLLPQNENQYYKDFNKRSVKIKMIQEGSISDKMVFIPAGDFLMGSQNGSDENDEKPRHIAYTESYLIDMFEVSFKDFNVFCTEGGYSRPEYWPEEARPSLNLDERARYFSKSRIWHISDKEIRERSKSYSSYLPPFTNEAFEYQYYYRNEIDEIVPLLCVGLADELAIGHRLSRNGSFPVELFDFPVAGVTWYEAAAFAEYKGKRLPSEKEWEKAASGVKGYAWPWGRETNDDFVKATIVIDYLAKPANEIYDKLKDEYKASYAVAEDMKFELRFPAHRLPNEPEKCGSPFGCFHMQGNLWEWVEDRYELYPNGNMLTEDQLSEHQNLSVDARVLRGGSFKNSVNQAKAQNRNADTPFEYNCYYGFRCVKDIE